MCCARIIGITPRVERWAIIEPGGTWTYDYSMGVTANKLGDQSYLLLSRVPLLRPLRHSCIAPQVWRAGKARLYTFTKYCGLIG